MKHEEAISEVLRLLDDNKKRQFPFLTEKEESAVRALLAQVKELTAEHARVTQIRDNYAAAARVIALYLDDYCDRSLPYDQMIAAASRNVEAYVSRLTAERDEWKRRAEAAVRDMEKALADTDACNLCKHYEPNDKDSDCKIMHYDDYGMNLHGKCIFEWRGPCAENANTSEIPTP